MRPVKSLNHTRWECKYHVVFIPKYRRKMLFGQLSNELGSVFHTLARQKESVIEEGHVVLTIHEVVNCDEFGFTLLGSTTKIAALAYSESQLLH